MWKCQKCKEWIEKNIDPDFHENTFHPNWSDAYINTWYSNGRSSDSPYF